MRIFILVLMICVVLTGCVISQPKKISAVKSAYSFPSCPENFELGYSNSMNECPKGTNSVTCTYANGSLGQYCKCSNPDCMHYGSDLLRVTHDVKKEPLKKLNKCPEGVESFWTQDKTPGEKPDGIKMNKNGTLMYLYCIDVRGGQG